MYWIGLEGYEKKELILQYKVALKLCLMQSWTSSYCMSALLSTWDGMHAASQCNNTGNCLLDQQLYCNV